MAARSNADSCVNERRLRPIYDCLDNGNNKKALQEADKLLKKQKDFLCAKALKALALIRLGRQEEAYSILRDVHLEEPTDEATLQAMTISYRELHEPELIADAYSRATKKDPQNEELLSHLFMSHVRIGDYKKQQQTAMALYKLKPKNPYYFWAIMSIVMQASVEEEKLAKEMLLPLAQRMTEKFVKENRLEAEAEVQLYLMILEQQEKYDEAIKVLEGPLSDRLSPYQDFLPKRKAEYLIRLQRWPEANGAYRKLILSNPDQWSYYIEYFKSVSHLVDESWHPEENSEPSEESIDYTFEMAIDFVSALVEEQNGARDGRRLRGPYLAQIELLKQLLERNDPTSSKIGTLVDVLFLFYENFGTKPCCYIDLSHVMSSSFMDDEEIKVILQKIKSSLSSETGEDIALPKDVRQMYRHLCYSLLCYYFGHQDDWNQREKLAYARELVERYHHALQFGSNLLATEFQPADNYCLLAAHTLIGIWRNTGDERLIAQVMILLEQGLKSSPSNSQMKLLLMKLYNAVGAVGATYALYESIDVKHVQQETLGYLITEPLLSASFYTAVNIVLGTGIRFFTSNYKDTVDYLISCYKFGSFTKIPELVSFRERVNNSLQYSLLTGERMILDLIMEPRSYQETEKTITYMEIDPEKDKATDALTDNRDIMIFRLYSENDRPVIEEQIKQSFQEQVWWLKIRNLIVRMLAASLYLTKSTNHVNNATQNNVTNGEKRSMADVLNDLIANLKDVVASIDKENLIDSVFPIQAPGPSRLLKYLQGGHIDTLIALSKLVMYIYSLTEGSSLDSSENKCDVEVMNDIRNNFQVSIKKLQEIMSLKQDSICPTLIKSYLEDIANIAETLSLATLLVSMCHTLLKPTRNSVMRKGKKKKENVPQITQEAFKELSNLINEMESVANSLQDFLNELDVCRLASSLRIMSLGDSENCLKSKEDTVHQVTSKIENSYYMSFKELRELLQFKIKYIQSLKW